ncbi:MAG: AraC family transcriptional regulator [Pseudomonadota bacterium]
MTAQRLLKTQAAPSPDPTLTPTAELDTTKVEAERRADLFLSHLYPGLPTVIDLKGKLDFNVQLQQWRLPNILFCRKTSDAFRSAYTIQTDPATRLDIVMIRMLLSGSIKGVVGNSVVRVNSGDMYVMDYNASATMSVSASEMMTLYLPYDAIGYDPDPSCPFRHIGADTSVGRVLSSIMQGFASALPDTALSDVGRLERSVLNATTALLANAEAPDGTSTAPADSRRSAIADHIRQTLGAEQVDVEALCRKFSISRATLYRDMAPLGGVEKFAAECRLDAAYRELAGGPARRGMIRAIAERWGYFDPSHFNRCFRQKFGISPSDVPLAEYDIAARRYTGTPVIGEMGSLPHMLYSIHRHRKTA